MRTPSGRRPRERGFTIVAFSLMLFVLIGFTGLAVDVGYLQLQKRKVQSAADAAAMGALREMEKGQTDLTLAGQNDASFNGFTDGQNDTTVSVNNPPIDGNYAGQTSAVEATVQRVVPTFFMRAFGQNSVTVAATAVAKTSTTAGSIGGCIFVMDPSVDGAFTITGTVTISTACSAVVNSTSSSAYSMVGNSTLSLGYGAKVGVVGPGTAGTGWSLSGGAQILDAATGQPKPPVNIKAFNDPLASVAVPTPSGLTVQGTNSMTIKPSDSVTLSPGIYCGGLTVKGIATMQPGTYVLAGGGLTVDSQATLTGTGVMIYNTSSGSDAWGCSGNQSAGSFTFNGGASINLSAQTDQSPVGVLFFEDRNVSGLSHKINGNSTSTFDGAMYFLNSYLTFSGTNQTPGFLFIVSDTLTMNGTSNLGNDHSTLANVYTLAPAATGGGLVQ